MKDATHLFSQQRADDSRALVEISRELDRPGLRGAFSFVIPLVVDSIFNKIAPAVFSPNTIAMLQKQDITFQGIRRRKRLDRVLQTATLGSIITTIAIGSKQLIRILAKFTGQRSSTVSALLACSLAVATLAKKTSLFLIPGLAPADVLNKAQKDKDKAVDGSY